MELDREGIVATNKVLLTVCKCYPVTMSILNTLENVSTQELHTVFCEAFGDYSVPIDMPLERFQSNMKRNGYDPSVSVGAFADGKLVGFIMSGHRIWEGCDTAYDMGTGVMPAFRGQGIAKDMVGQLKTLLADKGLSRYILEVITTNTKALSLYEKSGFRKRRDFSCLRVDKSALDTEVSYRHDHPYSIDFTLVEGFWDESPSWQNSSDSIQAVIDSIQISTVSLDGRIVGYGLVNPANGDISQLAVDKAYRKRGIGRSLISDLASMSSSKQLRLINVADEAIQSFLLHLGFEIYVRQYEMELVI